MTIRLTKLLRTHEWWSYKLPFALSVSYCLIWQHHLAVETVWLRLILLFLAGITSGAYASIVNDFTDVEEDRIAGKTTELMGFTDKGRGVTLTLSVLSVLGVITVMLAMKLFLSAICLASIALVYTLYSVPPVRLKARGVWGVLCVAMGEHVLAAWLAICLVMESGIVYFSPHSFFQQQWLWFLALCTCSLCYGLRSIAWHQLSDHDNDVKTNTATFATVNGADKVIKLIRLYLFPVEVFALLIYVWSSSCGLAWAFLALYMCLEWLRWHCLKMNVIIVVPQPNFRFALVEYYQLLLPLSFLLSISMRDRAAALLIIAQVILFPHPALIFTGNIAHLLKWHLWHRLRYRFSRTAEPSGTGGGDNQSWQSERGLCPFCK